MKARKTIQKDRALPLKRAITDKLFQRKDSTIWQAKFAGPDGKLVRRATGTRNRAAAIKCLVLLKRHFNRVADSPPPTPVPCVQVNLKL